MIAFLEELMAKLFGARDNIAIPVPVEDERPRGGPVKGRK